MRNPLVVIATAATIVSAALAPTIASANSGGDHVRHRGFQIKACCLVFQTAVNSAGPQGGGGGHGGWPGKRPLPKWR